MSDSPSLSKLVPGFDFLQTLVKGAGSALPGIGQWVAPTLNPEEIEKRIEELRTVQFWLEQNARMLGVTIQALEVQRMTLSTLKTMNVPVDQLSESLQAKMPGLTAPVLGAVAATASPGSRSRKRSVASSNAAAANLVDPMQWWGALTKQFAQLAAGAVKDSATDAAKNLAGAVVKQGVGMAGETLKKAASVPAKVARGTRAGQAATAGAPRRKA
jgi:hypothetical protein